MASKKLFSVLCGLFLLIISPAAFALKCVNAVDGSASIVQQIPANIAIPADAAAGTIIWESPQYNISATCSQDWGSTSDQVYLYVNPANVPPATGLVIGVRYNGTVYQQSSGKISVGQKVNSSKPTVTFPLSFSVVLIKSAATPTGGAVVFNSYRVFQLDGSGGLNTAPNSNLNFLLNGQFIFIGCYADLTFSPSSTVDFGTLPSVGVAGTVAATRPLTLVATRACASPYKLGIYFNATSPTTLANSTTWNLGNGMGVSLVDGTSAATVPLDGTISSFVDLSSLSTGSRSYTVQLTRLVANATPGQYSGTMTVLLNYQ